MLLISEPVDAEIRLKEKPVTKILGYTTGCTRASMFNVRECCPIRKYVNTSITVSPTTFPIGTQLSLFSPLFFFYFLILTSRVQNVNFCRSRILSIKIQLILPPSLLSSHSFRHSFPFLPLFIYLLIQRSLCTTRFPIFIASTQTSDYMAGPTAKRKSPLTESGTSHV